MQARRHAQSNRVISDDRAQRQAGGERFCDDRYIRLRRKLLKSEVAPGPAQSALNFISDQQSAVFARESAGALPKLFSDREDAALPLNGFQNDCANGIVEFRSGTSGSNGARYFSVAVTLSAPKVRPWKELVIARIRVLAVLCVDVASAGWPHSLASFNAPSIASVPLLAKKTRSRPDH